MFQIKKEREEDKVFEGKKRKEHDLLKKKR